MSRSLSRQLSPWIVILVPLTMIFLGYLFLKPHEIPVPTVHNPLVVAVFSPVDAGLFQELLTQNRLPGFARIQSSGVTGKLELRKARSETQAWLELMTGKDATTIPGSAVSVDPQTYVVCLPNPLEPAGTTPLWTILNWQRKRVRIISRVNELDGADLWGVDILIARIRRPADTSIPDKDYLLLCDEFLARLQTGENHDNPLIAVVPFFTAPCHATFAVNRWLAANNFLTHQDNAIVWPDTRAFCAGDPDNGIRINLQSVYAHGIVEPGDYEELQLELCNGLRDITLPGTDTPLFSGCVDGRNVYRSRKPHEQPDVVPITPDGRSVYLDSSLTSHDDRDTFVVSPGGSQCPAPGWIGFTGAPFRTGELTETLLSVDLTTTVLFLLDQPLGEDMQGRILYPVLTADWQQKPRRTIPTHDRFNYRVHQPDRPADRPGTSGDAP